VSCQNKNIIEVESNHEVENNHEIENNHEVENFQLQNFFRRKICEKFS
jgi:hypothetical protein